MGGAKEREGLLGVGESGSRLVGTPLYACPAGTDARRYRGDTIDRISEVEGRSLRPFVAMTTPQSPPPDPPRAQATLLQVASAVFWSFFGVRKGKHMERDAVSIKPLHIVIAGLVGGVIFVLALVALVTFLTRKL